MEHRRETSMPSREKVGVTPRVVNREGLRPLQASSGPERPQIAP